MTTLQRVRRGLHIRLNWPILRAGVPEDFTNAESLTLHISRVNNNVKTFIPDTHISISGNVVSFIVTSDMLKSLTSGEYKATISYRKVSATSPTLWEPYIKDEPCFALVDSSAEVGGSTTGMEVVTIELAGEIGLPKEGLPGASAYQIALAHGFEGDEAEWLLSLKQPAIDAAALAIQAAGAADAAAGKANTATSELDAIKQFLSQAESGRNTAEENRETKEGQRQQVEEDRNTAESGRNTAEENRETKEGQRQQAEEDRNTAEGGRNTAEGNRETKEGQRNQAEEDRKTAEGGRNTAEENRETKEGKRNQAEEDRNTAEGGRNTAEENRETKEGQRQEIEQQRAQAEITRGTTFDQKIQAATDAANAANAAAGAQNTYNVTVAVPLAAGSYYTKTTARAAVPAVSRKLGLVITYSTTDKVWNSEKYIGSTVAGWATEENWEYVPTIANLATKSDKTELEQLRSDIAYMYPSVPTSKRVLADAGTIKSRSTLNELTNKFLDLLPNTKLLFCPHLAVKLRESGIYKYVTKLYDVGPGMLDGAQTTALTQPYLSGNIAPNEKYAIKNPNGGNTYLSHTPISFSATDKWSVSTMININSNYQKLSPLGTYLAYCGKDAADSIGFINSYYSILSNNALERATSIYQFNKFSKNVCLTWVASGNNTVKIYENGRLIETLTTNSSFEFSLLFRGRQMDFNGSIGYHCIRNIALTTQQVQDEYDYLRTLFPEIENVQIGTQTWATSNCEMACTPQGNAIQEMQAATNVDRVLNGGFDTVNNWDKANGITISDGSLNFTNVVNNIYARQPGVIKPNTWYRYSINIKALINGGIKLNIGGYKAITIAGSGINTGYVYAPSNSETSFYIQASGETTAVIDDVSMQEVGWSDSTNLYNSIYAATTGTAEQKEYAAVKAASMWCHCNNDPALGAIYGKLYNWYAIKLLQMDIDYYNAANPATPWGWRVPVKTDFDTLIAYLGGASIAGGKIKKEGLNYWFSPNYGADNSSGFSILGSGYRNAPVFNGIFSGNKVRSILGSSSEASNGCHSLSLDYNVSTVVFFNDSKAIGYVLRLIKS